MRANGASHAINQTSKIVAPSLGGLALLWLAPAQVFLITAAVSVLAAAMLTRLAPLPKAKVDAAPIGLLTDLRAGWDEATGKPVVRRVLTLLTLGYFAMFFYDTLIAPLMRDLGHSATGLGISIGAVGAGGVLGAVVLGRGAGPRQPFLWIAGGAAISAVMVGSLGAAALLHHAPGIPLIAVSVRQRRLCHILHLHPDPDPVAGPCRARPNWPRHGPVRGGKRPRHPDRPLPRRHACRAFGDRVPPLSPGQW